MKIIHILLGKANPKKMNGVNVVVDRYANMMHGRGYDVEVWGVTYKPHINIPTPKYPIKLFQQYSQWSSKLDDKLIECLKKIDVPNTVVHFHGGFIREFSRIAKTVKGLKYFIMPHGAYAENCFFRRQLSKYIYWKFFEKQFISKSRGLILLHKREMFREITKDVNATPCHIIPNGTEMKLFQSRTEYRTSSKENPIVWGYCGRIDSKNKGVDLMISSFIQFAGKRGKKHVLSIVGDGPDLKMLKFKYSKQVESGLIVFHGALFEESKINILKEMNYFILLSRSEGLPLGCLDALALGIPLLITPQTNLAENITSYQAGVITLHEKEAVVSNMQRIFEMDHQDIVDGCLRLVKGKYNWKISCDKLILLYEKVL